MKAYTDFEDFCDQILPTIPEDITNAPADVADMFEEILANFEDFIPNILIPNHILLCYAIAEINYLRKQIP